MTTASAVVVGGGVIGCAAAFFLAERGEHDVVLIERDQLGQGTSKGGLGGVRHQFEDESDGCPRSRSTRPFVRELYGSASDDLGMTVQVNVTSEATSPPGG